MTVTKKIKHRLGFATAYLNKDDSVGFIGIDDHSGGYPYFSNSLQARQIHSTALEAVKEVEGLPKGMTTYYGSDKVRLDTFQVVEVIVQTADDVFVHKEVQKELLAKAQKTFSEPELAMLKDILAEGLPK